MAQKTATRQAEGKGGEPGQESITIKKNNTTTGAKNQALLSGYGGYHSEHPDSKNPRPYLTIAFEQIQAMAETPGSMAKDKAQWIIPSTTTGEYARVHQHQRDYGQFVALWADIDEVQGLTWADVVERIQAAIPGAQRLIYTTKSARDDLPKSRAIIPLAAPIPGQYYSMVARIFNNRLQAAGLIPDRATERPGQLCYLPNKGEFYRYLIIEGDPLDVRTVFADEIRAEQARQKKEAEAREARHLEALRKTQARIDSGQADPVEAYKAAYPVETALERYGYTRRGNRWLSPRSESGNPGVSVFEGGGL